MYNAKLQDNFVFATVPLQNMCLIFAYFLVEIALFLLLNQKTR